MVVSVSYYTDPACPWSWAAEPWMRKLMVQFGDVLDWTLVMGGLARKWPASDRPPEGDVLNGHGGLIRQWLQIADRTRAPLDPLIWVEGPPATSYPACMAVKAAAEQGIEAELRYLRRLREGLMCERRKLDHAEALVEEARGAGLDTERFRFALRSHATTEAFGADLEQTQALARAAGDEARPGDGEFVRGAGGAPLPTMVFRGDSDEHAVFGFNPYERYRDAALAAGAAQPDGAAPSVEELVSRFGRVTTREVEVICELPGPRAGAELYRMAEQWKLRPLWRMTEYMWEAA
jgi:predicted DsbA family dithiol-disulfide isomerase